MLITVTIKAPTAFFTIVAGAPAVVSLLMVYFSAIVAALKLKSVLDFKYKNRVKINKIVSFIIGVIIPSILVYVIILVIFTLIGVA